MDFWMRAHMYAAHVIAHVFVYIYIYIGRRCRAPQTSPTNFFLHFTSHTRTLSAPRLQATHAAHAPSTVRAIRETVQMLAARPIYKESVCERETDRHTQPHSHTNVTLNREYRSLYCCVLINEMSVIKTVLLWSNVFVGSLVYTLFICTFLVVRFLVIGSLPRCVN